MEGIKIKAVQGGFVVVVHGAVCSHAVPKAKAEALVRELKAHKARPFAAAAFDGFFG